MKVFVIFLVALCIGGCINQYQADSVLKERKSSWRAEIENQLNQSKSIQDLEAWLHAKGVDGKLNQLIPGGSYSMKLETVNNESLPCGYADIRLSIEPTSYPNVGEFYVGSVSTCQVLPQ